MLIHVLKRFDSGAVQTVAGFGFFGVALVHVLDSSGKRWWRINTPRQLDQREWWML